LADLVRESGKAEEQQQLIEMWQGCEN